MGIDHSNIDNSYSWFLQISEIELGGSSVLGGNYAVFYTIHVVAISMIVTSLISSAIVIVSILQSNCQEEGDTGKSRLHMEFADRFPLYQAVADCLLSISHLVDHLYLVISLRYPSSENVSTLLSINLLIFLGYQQFMHAGLAFYAYMRVVRRVDMNLGKVEWKLHGTCGALIAATILVFYPYQSFGPAGYWMLQNVRTTGGCLFSWYIVISGFAQAIFTTLAYREIKKVVDKQKLNLVRRSRANINKPNNYSTASECLTTFVVIGQVLYCPLALFMLAFLIQTMCGVIEPFTVLFLVISGNSAGWANALGYWHNLRVKSTARKMSSWYIRAKTSAGVGGNSSGGTNSDNNAQHHTI